MMEKRLPAFLRAGAGVTLALFAMGVAANGAEGPRRIIQFQMTSETFQDGGLVPPELGFTKSAEFPACFGENASPQLSWINVRAGTKSFALTMHELDDPPNYHLVVYGIPASVREFAEGELSKPSEKFTGGRNSRNMGTWRGMCPMPGQKKHYEFALRATDLDANALPPGLTARELDEKLEGHVLGRAILIGRFIPDEQVKY